MVRTAVRCLVVSLLRMVVRVLCLQYPSSKVVNKSIPQAVGGEAKLLVKA